MFLFSLAGWFRWAEYRSIQDRIYKCLTAIVQAEPLSGPGFVRGRYFCTWTEEIKQLKRDGQLNAARDLLVEILDVIEAQAAELLQPPPPWYYDQLRIVYKKLGLPQEASSVVQRHEKHALESRLGSHGRNYAESTDGIPGTDEYEERSWVKQPASSNPAK